MFWSEHVAFVFVCISLADTFFTRCYKNVRDTDLGLGFSTGGDLQIKIIATSGCMTAAKCIKFVSGRGFAPDHATHD